MRKIFLLLSTVMMSVLSLQATLLKDALDLTVFTATDDATWTVATKEVSTSVNTRKGITHWYGTLDATDQQYAVLELKAASAVSIDFNIRYSDNTNTLITIPAGNLEGYAPVTNSTISAIDIYLNAAGSATLKSLYLCKVVGKINPDVVWEGTHEFGDWQYLGLSAQEYKDKYAQLHEGDIIELTYSDKGETPACQFRISSTNAKLSNAGEYSDVSGDTQLSFAVSATDVAALSASGMYLNGHNMTIKKVRLLKYEQQMYVENVLNSGDTTQLEWGERLTRREDKPTFEEGDQLRVTVMEIRNESNKQIYFGYDGTFGNYYSITGIDNTVPKVYTLTLTAEQAATINAADRLFVTGTGVTINRFSYAKQRSIYNTLYHGDKTITWTPDHIEASNFSSLSVGDVLCANVTDISLGTYPQLWMVAGNYTEFEPKAHYTFNTERHAMPMTVSYVVDAEMLAMIQENGMSLRGSNCKVSDVYVQSASATSPQYTLNVTSAGMATLVLPFNVLSLPDGVEAYTLTNNGDETIWATPISSISADKPVLIVAAAGPYTFIGQEGGNWDISGKSSSTTDYADGQLIGNYLPSRTVWGTTDGNYNYVLQKHGEEAPAFYQVRSNNISLSPYRAYLSCGFNANQGGANPAPKMRIAFHNNTTTGMDNTNVNINAVKVLRNGVEYNVNGQIVK